MYLITGSNGLLGQEFYNILPKALYASRTEVDITDKNSIETYI